MKAENVVYFLGEKKCVCYKNEIPRVFALYDDLFLNDLTLIYRKPAEILTKTSILMQNCTADDMAKRNWQNKGWDLKKGLFYQSRK